MEEKLSPRRRLYDRGMRGLVWLCAGLTCALLLFLIGYIFYRGVPGITWSLLTSQTSYIKDTVGRPAQHSQHPVYHRGGHGHRPAPGGGGRHLSDGVRRQPPPGGRHSSSPPRP